MKRIGLLDYGIGNVKSIQNALIKEGAKPVLSRDEKEILSCDALILPGVGAFGKGMENLNEMSLTELIQAFVASGKPFLGICLGMQMLFEESEEFGAHKGLGLIEGKVKKIETDLRLPHIGWSAIYRESQAWDSSILSNINEGDKVYFVHTYAGNPSDSKNELAHCLYGGKKICAAVRKDNVFGTQFHPEKSGNIGLRIMNNFINQ